MTKEKNYHKIRIILSKIIYNKYLNFVQNSLNNFGFAEFCKIECSVSDEQIIELIDLLPESGDVFKRIDKLFETYKIKKFKVEVY